MTDVNEKISELKEHQRNTDILIREYEQAHNFQLNELKESLRGTRINLHNRIQRYEEVLRELGEKLIGWQKEKQTDYDKLCFVESLQHTLKKLDARQMEEHKHEFMFEVHASGVSRLRCECGIEADLHPKSKKIFHDILKVSGGKKETRLPDEYKPIQEITVRRKDYKKASGDEKSPIEERRKVK